jgi:nicotinate phosphoribosyltransferase
MGALTTLYKLPLGLLTDLYQLTMAYGYFKAGIHDREAVFHLFFRNNPFRGGLAVAAGLATALDYLENLRFDQDDMAYLAALRGNDERPLFEPAFLDFLQRLVPQWDVDGIPEGTVVFPHEPLLRIQGPLLQAQLLETALLNIINFQTLIATKAARVVMAARGEPVLEFGLRRAHGVDGALAASRAAYLGGCAATSNVLAGRLYGIPVKGTHAHSWVMCFDDELQAFRAYAEAMPNNCVFLVDTYDTLQGVRHAVEVGRWLRQRGHELMGIRLDSGDLAYLSIEARRILDQAGFPDALIIASNDLDEHIIASLKQQGATIGVWGVGTRLVTAHDQPALGGVYKLAAIRQRGGPWQYKVKLSEQAVKVSTPGILQVRRFSSGGQALADVIYDRDLPLPDACVMVDPLEVTRRKTMAAGTPGEDLLVPIFRHGKRVYQVPSLDEARRRTQEQLSALPAGVKRFVNPHQYPVGLEERLHQRKTELMLKARS